MTSTTTRARAPQSRAKRLAANREASAASRARKREIEREMRAKCAYLEMMAERARAAASALAMENARLRSALLDATCGVPAAATAMMVPMTMSEKVAIPADPRVWDVDAWMARGGGGFETTTTTTTTTKGVETTTPTSDSDEDASMGCVLGNLDFDLTPDSFADTYTECVSHRTRRSSGADEATTRFCEDGGRRRRRDFTRCHAHEYACEPRADIAYDTHDMLLANEIEELAKNLRIPERATLTTSLATDWTTTSGLNLVNFSSTAASTTTRPRRRARS